LRSKIRSNIRSVYFDPLTDQRLEALSAEMLLSRSAVLRVLVAEKWQDRQDRFLSAVTAFDAAKSKREAELMQGGLDPLDALTLAHREK
jgi:hypothetical protein